MDKIGWDGVRKELLENFPEETVDAYLVQFAENEDPAALMEGSDLPTIIAAVDAVKTADFKVKFDPTLVRGMGYYTGPIFEIAMDEFGGSVGGGGRYDEMIGKFTGQPTPAVGFSIGFERIIMLLLERGFKVPDAKEKVAFLIEKKIPGEKLTEVFKAAEEERKAGRAVLISVMKKNKKFQKDQLQAEGYTEIREIFAR
jgi:histidyl-tRNA synthetase